MKAYHGDEAVKEKYLARVRAHRAADELVQGYGYWKDGKGCAVGCTVHSGDHKSYETELGIPERVARIEDLIFERLPVAEARLWPERFLEAISVGSDLSLAVDRWLHWILVDPTEGVIKFAKREETKLAIQKIGDAYAQRIAGNDITRDAWLLLRKDARAAYHASWAAADAAAAAAAAAAADAAADAADAADAAAAAADAADAAAAAAAAADAAAAAAADAAAWYSFREKRFVLLAEKFLEFLRTSNP